VRRSGVPWVIDGHTRSAETRRADDGGRVASAFRSVARFLGRVDEPTYRFYLRALREADPAFGKEARPSESWMSLEWLVRDARRSAAEA